MPSVQKLHNHRRKHLKNLEEEINKLEQIIEKKMEVKFSLIENKFIKLNKTLFRNLKTDSIEKYNGCCYKKFVRIC